MSKTSQGCIGGVQLVWGGEGERGGEGEDGCSPRDRTRWREGAGGDLSVEQSWSDTSPLSTLVKVRGLGTLNCTTRIEN